MTKDGNFTYGSRWISSDGSLKRVSITKRIMSTSLINSYTYLDSIALILLLLLGLCGPLKTIKSRSVLQLAWGDTDRLC